MRNIIITIVVVAQSITSCSKPIIYRDNNGITIKCSKKAKIGKGYMLDGVISWVVDKDMLWGMIKDGEDVSKVCTSKITDMSWLFNEAYDFNQDISSWDVSNVTNMQGIFWDADEFHPDISSWDVNNVTNMEGISWDIDRFYPDMSNWNLNSSINASKIFVKPIYLDANGITVKCIDKTVVGKSYNLNGTKYLVVDRIMLKNMIEDGRDVTKICTSKVTNMSWLLEGFSRMTFDEIYNSQVYEAFGIDIKSEGFNQDISNWDVSNVTNMANMFVGARDFNQDISNWDVSNVTNMSQMFMGAENFDKDISNWDVSKVSRCHWFSMYKGAQWEDPLFWKKPRFFMNNCFEY